jgi:hypothetical protein
MQRKSEKVNKKLCEFVFYFLEGSYTLKAQISSTRIIRFGSL